MTKEIFSQFIPEQYTTYREGNIILFSVPKENIGTVARELYHEHKLQLKTITAMDVSNGNEEFRIYYVFGVPQDNIFIVPFIILKQSTEFPSIVRDVHEAVLYERKINSFFGLKPVGHPDLRSMILHDDWPEHVFPLRKDFDWKKRPPIEKNVYTFHTITGEGIYEIPVGPVHAGIIEPGHFRFSVAGEEILLLEPRLGYTHKGSEKLFEQLALPDKVRLSERISGDTSFTHSLAFCQALENLSEIQIPERARYLRLIFSELERLANHINDIGFILQDTGYSFGGSNGARLREIIMQWNERLTGSRFLRGINTPGGVLKNISSELRQELSVDLIRLRKDFHEIVEISQNSSSVLNRLGGTGILDKQIALDHGIIGVAGRAVGIPHDARIEYPYAAYNIVKPRMILENAGDVLARFNVRVREIYGSFDLLHIALDTLPSDALSVTVSHLRKNGFGIGIAEGWRGDIVYVVKTGPDGAITRADIRDPSFLNWPAVSYAGTGNVVPDFPLINKSFNLSYSGNDL